MWRLQTRRSGWLDLSALMQGPDLARCIATASAIHRGLRRSKGAPEPSYGSRRGPRLPESAESAGPWSDRSARSFDRKDRTDQFKHPRAGSGGEYGRPERNEQHRAARPNTRRRIDTGPDWDVSDSSGYSKSERRRTSYERKDADSPGLSHRPYERRDAGPGLSHRPYERRDAGSGLSGKPYERRESDYGGNSRSFNKRREFQEDNDRPDMEDGQSERKTRGAHKLPTSIPYTTAASEFLYGTSVVEAALRSSRRQLYKLYAMRGKSTDRDGSSSRAQLLNLAQKRRIPVELLEDQTTLLDKMSTGRPHNGVALEASPLKRPSAECLLPSDSADPDIFKFKQGPQSEEDRRLHGSENIIARQSKQRRHPFVLMLDGVQDTGNMGGIIRTAHFLGVDAVVLSATCAPMNAVVLKASAGAAEQLPLLYVANTSGFIQQSRDFGWKFYASVAPPKQEGKISRRGSGHQYTHTMESPLPTAPCVLMIGGEGTGLKADLVKKADRNVSIPSWRFGTSSVDSLNVSVATGILANAFLSLPTGSKRNTKALKGPDREEEDDKDLQENNDDDAKEDSDRSLW